MQYETKTALAAGTLMLITGLGLLAGCAALQFTGAPGADGQPTYRFGDLSRNARDRVIHLNELYCSEANAGTRGVLLTVIRMEVPIWPAGGVCSIEERIEHGLGAPKAEEPK